MKIVGRADQPWDTLFIFHFLDEGRNVSLPDELRKLVAREEDSGSEFGRPVMAKNQTAGLEILGCFLDRDECTGLLSAWNQPASEDFWMCYTPNHGIATITDWQLDWWALICFYCSNAGLAGPSVQVSDLTAPNRNLPKGAVLEQELMRLLPDRTFPVREV